MQEHNPAAYKKIRLPFKIKKPVLALGSQAKNTVCFAKGKLAYLSAVHPDLSDPADLAKFVKDAEYFLKKKPENIAYDLHPGYESTKYAFSLKPGSYRFFPVQHHHAHIASCMAENGLKDQRVIGVAFDGTGLGYDDRLWGSEFLLCDYKNFKRAAYLKEIPLPGGEKAISEPARIAAMWLYQIYKDKFLGFKAAKITKYKWSILKKMYLSRFNCPLASSMGRLFDAAGSLVLGRAEAKFEAELAIGLEKLAQGLPPVGQAGRPKAQGYKFHIIKAADKYIIDPLPVFKGIIDGLKAKEAKEEIAYRFHQTVAQMISRVSVILREKSLINKVVLSGGVFQNKLLHRMAAGLLYKERFEVFSHKKLPCGDASISLGQALAGQF